MIEEFLLLFRRFNPAVTAKLPRNAGNDEIKRKGRRDAAYRRGYRTYFLSKSDTYAS
jgi:hypothetical protein